MRPSFTALVARDRPPYGFANTAPNEGHLNADGHRAVAAALTHELLRRDLL
jgi:hypothetical protein